MQMVPTAAGLVPGAVTEQIVIRDTNRKGAYASVTGHLAVLGNSIGQNAAVAGQLIYPLIRPAGAGLPPETSDARKGVGLTATGRLHAGPWGGHLPDRYFARAPPTDR